MIWYEQEEHLFLLRYGSDLLLPKIPQIAKNYKRFVVDFFNYLIFFIFFFLDFDVLNIFCWSFSEFWNYFINVVQKF